MVEDLPREIFVLSKDGKIQYGNKAAAKLVSLGNNKGKGSTTFSSLLLKKDLEKFNAEFIEAQRKKDVKDIRVTLNSDKNDYEGDFPKRFSRY